MGKLRLFLAMTFMAGLAAGLLNAPAAQALPHDPESGGVGVGVQAVECDDKLTNSGYVHVYNGTGCVGGPICSTTSWDSDYGNSSGPCQGGDTNAASSVLNNGYEGSLQDVQFFNGTGTDWGGGWLCLQQNAYVIDLSGRWFTTGINANNQISSHRWVNAC